MPFAWINDYVDGPLRLAIASSRAGLIVELRVGDSPWFEVRQEQFEAARFEAHDCGDYFGMSIDAGGYRVGFGDAWNYPEHLDRLRAEFSSEE